MAYEQRDDSGSLFKNDRKENESQADYTGSAMLAGVEYWMSAWIKNKDDPSKKTFMSFSFKRKESKPSGGHVADAADDDSIPF